jgi:hypothetical protein
MQRYERHPFWNLFSISCRCITGMLQSEKRSRAGIARNDRHEHEETNGTIARAHGLRACDPRASPPKSIGDLIAIVGYIIALMATMVRYYRISR